jgi:DNA repair exonuclease SbcCD ATPase subunit
MADKRKYVSEFEIQSNVDEALKQLQKYYVEFSKMPRAVDEFNKSLKKNAQLEDNFFKMMSTIPKTMKKLSELSKIELVPKKELEKLSNTVQLIESVAKGLQGKATFDSGEVKKLVSEFENVVSELSNLETSQGRVLERADEYNKLATETLRLQKMLRGNSDKFKDSTDDIASSYTKIIRKVSSLGTELEKAKDQGTLSVKSLSDYQIKLESIRDEVAGLNDNYDTMNKNIESLSSDFNKVLSESDNIAKSMKNTIAQTSFRNTIDEIESLKDDFKDLLGDTVFSSEQLNDKFAQIKDQLAAHVEKMNQAVAVEERLTAETKTQNDAIAVSSCLISEILEETAVLGTYNTELRKKYLSVADSINIMRTDLEKMILSGNASNEQIREKIGLLKEEGDKLHKIVAQQEEIKKLDEQSISKTVERAREQNKINQAYIKQIKEQKRGLSGAVDAFKVFKQNIPNQAMATFGENGVVAAKAMTGAFKMLGAVLAPLAGAFSVVGAIKMAFELEKQVKGARKQIMMMAANTHNAGEAFDSIRKGGQLADTSIEKMRQKTEQWSWDLGVSMDQAIGYMGDFSKAGFTAARSLANLEDMMGIAASLGMEVGELASSAGSLRSEFGMSLSDIGTSFVEMQKNAKTAGITTTIFFDKVINAATGLGLYGKRIDEVSNMFSGLVKNMKLPEAAATSAAGKIVGSFKDLSNEAQITIFRLGGGAEIWKKSYQKQTKEIDGQIQSLIKQEQNLEAVKGDAAKEAELEEVRKQRAMLESRKRTLDNTNAMKGVNSEMEKGLMTDTMGQFLMQMGFLTKKAAGVDIGGSIEQVQKAIEGHVLNMKVVGAEFGVDREVVETMRSMASNLANNSKNLRAAFGKDNEGKDNAQEMINILSNSNSVAERTQGLIGVLKNLQTKNVDLKSVQKTLKTQFPELATQLSQDFGDKTVDGLAAILSGLDVNFKAMTDAQTKATKEEEKRKAKVEGLAALKQTKSTEDSLNNVLGVWLRKIFTILEKLVSIIVSSPLFSDRAKVFDELNTALTENANTSESLKNKIESRQRQLQIDEGAATTDEEKKAIANEQAKLGEASKKLTALIVNQEAQRKEMDRSGGKITPELKRLVSSSKDLGEDAIYNAGAIAEGMNFSTVAMPGAVAYSKQTSQQQLAASGRGFATGGVVPGLSFKGDKILGALNSGELVLPKQTWQNLSTGSGSPGGTVNDNRTINIYVNQNDRRQVEQIVLNALYSDKIK